MANEVLIVAEQREGNLHPLALQLVTVANELAPKLGGDVAACVVGHNVGDAADKMAATGIKKVIVVDDPALELYSALNYTRAVSAVIEKLSPKVLLMGTTFMGRDLAPRLAARHQAALVTDCTEVGHDNGQVHIRRPICNGKANAEMKLAADRLNIVSVRNNAYGAAATGDGAAEKETLPFAPGEGDDRATTTEVLRTGGEVKDVTEADIIVAGGRPLK